MDDFKYLDYLELHYKKQDFIKQYETQYRRYPNVYRINGLPIHLDKHAKKILVAFSGGADSSLLLYMLCTLIKREKLKTKIDVYTMIRFWEQKPWLKPMAEDAFGYLKKQFPDIIGIQHWGFLPHEFETVPLKKLNLRNLTLPSMAKCDVLITHSYQVFLLETYKYDWVYSGTTMNPPIDNNQAPAFRNEKVVKDNWDWVITGSCINPFGLLRKNYTMAQYVNYKLETLLKLTRSCEGDIAQFGEEYRHNRQYPPECGHCFFCQEKEWGKNNAQGFLLDLPKQKQSLWEKIFG